MFSLQWNNQLSEQIAAKLSGGLTRFNERLAANAKQQLYPGHGYRTGRLRGSLAQIQPPHLVGSTLVSSVGTPGVPYGLNIHFRYDYIVGTLHDMAGSALGIITGG